MTLTQGTIFPQDGKWWFVLKRNTKSVILRELLDYKIGDTKLKMGGKFKADIT